MLQLLTWPFWMRTSQWSDTSTPVPGPTHNTWWPPRSTVTSSACTVSGARQSATSLVSAVTVPQAGGSPCATDVAAGPVAVAPASRPVACKNKLDILPLWHTPACVAQWTCRPR